MIIVHAADIHLGSALRGLDRYEGLPVEQLRAAPQRAFERIADLCRERSADLLLIAGDLFDGNADMGVIAGATKTLRQIADGGTRVVTLRGNHDAASKMQRRLPRIEGVHELSTSRPETIPFDDIGVAAHGRGFDKQHVPDNIVTAYPARREGMFNIGMLHTSFEAASSVHAVYAPCSQSDLVAHGYDYWALGHIHQHGIVARDPWIVYAGSPQARHIGEVGEHGVYVLDVRDGQLVGDPEHVELGVVQWHRVEVAVDDPQLDADGVCALVRARLEQLDEADASEDRAHVARVTITGRCAAHEQFSADPARWRDELIVQVAAVGGAQSYLEKIVFETSPVLPPIAELRLRDDVVGMLAAQLAEVPSGELDPVPAIARLDEKLDVLGADTDVRGHAVDTEELARAGDDLLAQLMHASQSAGAGESQ